MLHFWTAKSRREAEIKLKLTGCDQSIHTSHCFNLCSGWKRKQKEGQGLEIIETRPTIFVPHIKASAPIFHVQFSPFLPPLVPIRSFSLLTTRLAISPIRSLIKPSVYYETCGPTEMNSSFKISTIIRPNQSWWLPLRARSHPEMNENHALKKREKEGSGKVGARDDLLSASISSRTPFDFFQRPAKVVKVNVTINIVIAFTFWPPHCVDLMAFPSTSPSLSLQARHLLRVDT